MTSTLLADVSNVFVNLSIEVVVIAAVLTVAVFYALYAGRGKAMALLVGLLLAGGFYTMFDHLSWFAGIEAGGAQTIFLRVLVLLILTVVLVSVMRNVVHGGYPDSAFKKFFEAAILGVAIAGLTGAYAFNLLSVGDAYAVSPLAQTIFYSTGALFWWYAASLIALFIASKR